MGSALSTFNDFVNMTGPAFLTSADMLVNEAVKNTYILGRFLRGNDSSKILQGGREIRDIIMFDESNTAQYYLPNPTFTWSMPQVTVEHKVQWRYLMDHMAWTDQLVELQMDGGYTESARFAVYKRIKRQLEQRMWTSMINKMEDQLFAVPEVANMEDDGGTQPYSIPAFVNEESNTLYGSSATGAPGAAWTTVENISPTSETKWQNAVVRYTTASGAQDATPHADNILAAFDQMFYTVKFDTPPTRQAYFETDSLFTQFIACSRNGLNIYQQLLRRSNDQLVTTSRQDPAYTRPAYGGIDLVYAASLDTAALYEAETASATPVDEINTVGNSEGQSSGPRYYWLNGKYLCPVFHTSRYMQKLPVRVHPNQPTTHVAPVDCWSNLFCRSRQRLGIVSPGDGSSIFTQ
jgi:hypothetical protein